jgi:hypothetical protein
VAERSDVTVHRAHGQLAAIIHLPDEAEEIDGALAVAVAAVLRAHDRFATRTNVAVERSGSGPSAQKR